MKIRKNFRMGMLKAIAAALIVASFTGCGGDSSSDPVEQKSIVEEIQSDKGYIRVVSQEEYDFYKRFEKNVKEYFVKYKNRQICANVDYYSGFVYDMLDIPEDLFTPLFVQSRSVGWLAHNIEHKLYCDRIIRPAGKFIKEDE